MEPEKQLSPLEEILRDMEHQEKLRNERRQKERSIRRKKERYEEPITVPRASPRF
jgi:hypothetical protein